MQSWSIVVHYADLTPCDFSRRIARNWWLVRRISLRVISAVGSRVIGGIVANDADSTPFDFSRSIARFNSHRPIARFNLNRLIARFNPDRPIARFNPVRPISLFRPRRPHIGIRVGLRGPAMCLHHTTIK